MTERQTCAQCLQEVSVNKDGSLRAHRSGSEPVWCPGGRQPRTKTTVDDKAGRYLVEGRVQVARVIRGRVLAFVQGSREAPYTVEVVNGQPTCDCDAQIWRCSHVVAVERVLYREVLEETSLSEEEGRSLEDLPVSVVGSDEILARA